MNRKQIDRLGDVLLVAVVLGILYGGYLIARTRVLGADAAAYSEQAIRAMVDPWSGEEFVRRAAPDAVQRSGERYLTDLFRWYAGLGKLRMLEYPSGRMGSGAVPGTDIRGIWASYASIASFDSGPARIALTLKREGDAWQIADIRIESEAFNRMPSPPLRDGQQPFSLNLK